MDKDSEDYFIIWERAVHLEGAHTYLGKVLTGIHVYDPPVVELFVIDIVCSQSDQIRRWPLSIVVEQDTIGLSVNNYGRNWVGLLIGREDTISLLRPNLLMVAIPIVSQTRRARWFQTQWDLQTRTIQSQLLRPIEEGGKKLISHFQWYHLPMNKLKTLEKMITCLDTSCIVVAVTKKGG